MQSVTKRLRKWCCTLCAFLVILLACAAAGESAASLKDPDEYIVGIQSLDFLSEKGDYIVYFGRPTCPGCIGFEKSLLNYLEDTAQSVYYFNTDYWRDDSRFKQILSKYQVDNIPVLVKISNGQYVKSFFPDSSADEADTMSALATFFSEESPMSFELVNAFGRPVLFVNYFEFFTFVLMLFNCVSMVHVYTKKRVKDGCPVRLAINSTIVFVFHLVLCGFAFQYSMWVETVPSQNIIAQIGVYTWLFITPVLYFVILCLFALLSVYMHKESREEKGRSQ